MKGAGGDGLNKGKGVESGGAGGEGRKARDPRSFVARITNETTL